MILRTYTPDDFESVRKLFSETILTVNAADYTKEQLVVWAGLEPRLNGLILIAETDGAIVGFGSILSSGVLDLLYVHKDFQRRGVATALCDELEKGFPSVKTYASVTAKPFFERRGYTVVKEQEVERSGVKFKNYEMLMVRH
ncbi:MAG: GNAT family N-acetyltransferase [Clostridia bacterium]|nr:GNAT family N-acetyltransferase [Clostridia bacterium]